MRHALFVFSAGVACASLAACAVTTANPDSARTAAASDVLPERTAPAALAALPNPPMAERRDFVVESEHGNRADPYYWLRDDDREDAAMLAYLNAENAYTERVLQPVADLREALFQEITGRIKTDDASPPDFSNGYWYYTRYEAGQDYAINARRKGTMDAPEEILVDENERAKDHEYYALGELSVSPDNRWMAVAEDTVGRRQYTLRIRNLESGEWLADTVGNVNANLEWTNDSQSVLYIEKDPETLLGKRVRQHRLGSDDADPVVYEEADDSYYMGVGRSKTDDYLFIGLYSTEQSEILYADANAARPQFKPVLPREAGHEYNVSVHDGRFVIHTNWSPSLPDNRANNFRVVTVPVARSADKSQWQELIGHDPDVLLEGIEVFRDYLAINERSGGLRKIRIRPWDTSGKFGKERYIESAQPAYAADIIGSDEYDWPLLRYSLDTLTDPSTTIDYNMHTGEQTVVKVDPVVGDFDATLYASEYLRATARDGTQVPVSLVYRRDLRRDANGITPGPLLVYGYGSYGYSLDPYHSLSRLSLLDRGFVFAIAHVRGGQEMGRAWYDAGKLGNKQNTFNDFIDVTEHLIAKGYGAPGQVFASGGSAGGLLMGAVVNQRPDLYRAVVANVPFVDVVTTMLDESIPLTTNEFDEWGNPKNQPDYDTMLAYSPYDQVHRQDYPAMLVIGGLWDSQVQYWEPAKWVARLRVRNTGDAPLIMSMNMDAGHGGASGRFQRYREVALEQAFLLGLLGVTQP